MSDRKKYLGDGVFADHDGWNVILTAEDGIRATDTIYLEPEVLAALRTYADRMRQLQKDEVART